MTPDERTAANRQNRAIVQHLVSCRETGKPYCTTKELFECFGPDIPDDDDVRSFQKKLTYLSAKDAIKKVSGSGKKAHWAPGPNADAYCLPLGDRTEVKPKPKPKPVPWVGPIVPPRRVDVMHGPTYVPTHEPIARAGADDFRHCRSVGVHC